MKPTPTQIEAAARRLTELEGLNPDERASELHAGLIWEEYKDSAEAILSAALSVPAAAVVGEPVAWTGSGSMMAIADGREGFIWPTKADAHPIPLYAAPSAPDGWQSIETAPKDGKPIMLWHMQWLHPVMGRWSAARNGWIEYGSRDDKANVATHWRLLPSPPALGGKP